MRSGSSDQRQAAQLDAVAARHGCDDLAQDGIGNLLDVALVECGF
jgi:hypothetical protein